MAGPWVMVACMQGPTKQALVMVGQLLVVSKKTLMPTCGGWGWSVSRS